MAENKQGRRIGRCHKSLSNPTPTDKFFYWLIAIASLFTVFIIIREYALNA